MINPTDLDSEIEAVFADDIGIVYDNAGVATLVTGSAKARLQAIIARECDKARISEVESMAVFAVDMPELLPLLAARLDQLKAEAAQKGEV